MTSALGFPPPDETLRYWLLQSTTKIEALNRASTYLCALFITLLSYLQQVDDKIAAIGVSSDANLATKFRFLMTVGQTFSQQGAARKQFYNDVLQFADEVRLLFILCTALSSTTPASPKLSLSTINDAKGKSEYNLEQAVEELMKFLIPDFDALNDDTPVLILSFDEAHPLAEVQNDPMGLWS